MTKLLVAVFIFKQSAYMRYICDTYLHLLLITKFDMQLQIIINIKASNFSIKYRYVILLKPDLGMTTNNGIHYRIHILKILTHFRKQSEILFRITVLMKTFISQFKIRKKLDIVRALMDDDPTVMIMMSRSKIFEIVLICVQSEDEQSG